MDGFAYSDYGNFIVHLVGFAEPKPAWPGCVYQSPTSQGADPTGASVPISSSGPGPYPGSI
jgi:hypothetical protein